MWTSVRNLHLRKAIIKRGHFLCRFEQPGLTYAAKLEKCILDAANRGSVDESSIGQTLPEIDFGELKKEIPMLPSVLKQSTCKHTSYKKLENVLDSAIALSPSLQELIPSTLALLKLLLVFPSTAASAERSFSTLRRLKTYLRANMSQKRLSFSVLCHIQRELCNGADISSIMQNFVSSNPHRSSVFGYSS